MQRLDRLAGELNAFLMVFAIGLAILDATCFVAMRTSTAIEQSIVQQQQQQHPASADPGRAPSVPR
jgi:hypothetical protein